MGHRAEIEGISAVWQRNWCARSKAVRGCLLALKRVQEMQGEGEGLVPRCASLLLFPRCHLANMVAMLIEFLADSNFLRMRCPQSHMMMLLH